MQSGKVYSRDKCRYDSMAKKIGEQCQCKPRFVDDAEDLCKADTCNTTCRGAGVTCAAKMGTAVEYKDCPKPCYDVINEHSVSYSGTKLHLSPDFPNLISCSFKLSQECNKVT